jgi:hypothetical protein
MLFLKNKTLLVKKKERDQDHDKGRSLMFAHNPTLIYKHTHTQTTI